MRYLGLDLGSKTLGIAISDLTNHIASIYTTVRFDDEDYSLVISSLEEIVSKEGITTFVLGLPKNMNNTLGIRAEVTLDFQKLLEDNFHLPVILEDERLTSVISNNVLISANVSRKKRKMKVDGMAAVVILQGYLDKINR